MVVLVIGLDISCTNIMDLFGFIKALPLVNRLIDFIKPLQLVIGLTYFIKLLFIHVEVDFITIGLFEDFEGFIINFI